MFELITFDGSSTWVGCICYKISNQESGPEVVWLVGPSVWQAVVARPGRLLHCVLSLRAETETKYGQLGSSRCW